MAEPFDTLIVEGTVLTITGLGIPPYSAHGLTQTLEEVTGQSNFERDINNTLIDLSPPWEVRKLKSTISADDVNPPAFNGSPIGQVVTVGCIVEFAFLTSMGSGGYQRDVVSGSERTQGDWTFYRPVLTMIVTNFSMSKDEWPNTVGWTMDLEEQ